MSGIDPVINQPFLYMNGFQISNDPVTPDTLLDIGVGQCRDNTNSIDIISNAPIVINSAITGLNGLDIGTIAANALYYVYVVADQANFNLPGAVISLSATGPQLPKGKFPSNYSSWRLIGCVATASSNFVAGYWSGNNNPRIFTYDTLPAAVLSGGTSTSYAAVNLASWVPAINNIPVSIAYSFSPTAASNTLNLQAVNSVGSSSNQVTITGQVASVVISGNATVIAQNKIVSSVLSPEINYKVSAGTATLYVAGFQMYI